MSTDQLEQTVQAMLPLLRPHFLERAKKKFGSDIQEFDFTATQTKEKSGASGRVLISTIYYETDKGSSTDSVALKFFQNSNSAITEIRNAMDLEIKFRAAPEFGIPRVIFASTKDPVLIIYEGIKATNYDELDIEDKAWDAGRLLATIHGPQIKPVDKTLYRDLSRMIGERISTTGYEQDISQGLGYFYQKLEGAQSGCNPFSDFHQSNIMISQVGENSKKLFIIDPEFMQTGSFDRLEDIGTFFGYQLLQEFEQKLNVNEGIKDVNSFIRGYESKILELGGLKWNEIYANGSPLPFFIAQWALIDALDFAMNRGGNLDAPETILRLKFTKYILSLRNAFHFPE